MNKTVVVTSCFCSLYNVLIAAICLLCLPAVLAQWMFNHFYTECVLKRKIERFCHVKILFSGEFTALFLWIHDGSKIRSLPSLTRILIGTVQDGEEGHSFIKRQEGKKSLPLLALFHFPLSKHAPCVLTQLERKHEMYTKISTLIPNRV